MRLFKPNDWKVVWAESAVWTRTSRSEFTNSNNSWDENCFYIIEYSESRNKYRLKTSGYKPKDHIFYGDVLKTLAQFNTKE